MLSFNLRLTMKCCASFIMKKHLLLTFFFLFISTTLHAKNYFTDELADKGFRGIIEMGVGRDYYHSPSGMYDINQWTLNGSAILGYQINKMFLVGFGGEARRCNKDHTTSFDAFFSTRVTFPQYKLRPYLEARGGVVGYLKWNDFVKHYYAFGTGIHILPRLSTGVRVANFGALDNRNSWDISLSISFIIGG